MINNNVSDEDIASLLNITLKAVRHRFNGNTEFKRSEMLLIKHHLFPNYTLDQLFDDDTKIVEN